MLLLEHGSADGHPVFAAVGSQSCASLLPHVGLHSDAALPF